jgi:hypothetical protein
MLTLRHVGRFGPAGLLRIAGLGLAEWLMAPLQAGHQLGRHRACSGPAIRDYHDS